jgi:hypothetical protein
MPTDACVVLPTVRDDEARDCLRSYVDNARAHGFDVSRLEFVLVTETFCDVSGMESLLDDLGVAGRVFDGPRREAWLDERGVGDHADLIPEASHAQTSFGLLYLWAGGHDFGVFVDDDTRPHEAVDFFGRHFANLSRTDEVTHVASDESWVNVLWQSHDDHGLYPRGYPYGAMDEAVTTTTAPTDRVVASQGLWTDVPDLDAVRILGEGDLQGQSRTRTTADDYGDDFVAAPGNYLTVCSMNLAFRRELVPAFYQLPMDDNEWGVGRFDDIWSGVFAKRAADLVGDAVLSGGPLCHHYKAPRPTFDDLRAEAPALELNEHLWAVVDDVDVATDGRGPAAYATAFRAFADRLVDGGFDEWANGDFLVHVGGTMHEWLDCLDALAPVDDAETPRDATRGRDPAVADD